MTEKDKRYLRMAFIWAENSYAIRLQVGCLIVKDGVIISDGYNGTPSGFPNVCEFASRANAPDMVTDNRNKLIYFKQNGWDLKTHPHVLHAESNAIAKLAKSSNSSEGATIYVTDEPCIECAKLIIQAGIARVVYSRPYRLHDGIKLLEQAGVIIDQIPKCELKTELL